MSGRGGGFRGPPGAVAVSGILLICLALVLLALGGIATSRDPTAFDLWVLSVGVMLLIGAIGWLGALSSIFGNAYERDPASHGSLAEAPALSSMAGAAVWRPGVPGYRTPARGRVPAGDARAGRAAADSLAAQFAEVSREAAARRGADGGVGGRPGGGPPEPSDPGLGASDPVRPTAGARSGGPAGPRNPLEAEIERLRDRVRELEAHAGIPSTIATLMTAPAPPIAGWSGPSQCADCHTVLVGSADERRCVRCHRPLCASCAAHEPLDPAGPKCPDCRAAESLPMAALAGARSGGLAH